MSTSFTPSKDLILQAKVPPVPSLFTTFATGHFVKPGKFTQPVKPVVAKLASFAGCYVEVYAAAPIDLDYDEPNAVTDAELELIQPGSTRHQMELPVIEGLATNEIEAHQSETKPQAQARLESLDQRAAA